MLNLLEPWVLLRVSAATLMLALFLRAGWTSARVLRRFDVSRVTEGQLALERQVELASTFLRVAAVGQMALLVLTVLAADKLSHGVRGAMCAYGVFAAHPTGFAALSLTLASAVIGGVLAQLVAFDTRVRGLELVRPLSIATLAVLPLVIADYVAGLQFFTGLDLDVVASCCSVQLDGALGSDETFSTEPARALTSMAPVAVVSSIGAALFASQKSQERARVVAAAAVSLVALPVVIGAVVFAVAPHVFELPQHVCPFCLLRSDAWGIGYLLFGTVLVAVVQTVGAGFCALVARDRPAALLAFAPFARQRLLRGTWAWVLALALGVAPIARYFAITGGHHLLP